MARRTAAQGVPRSRRRAASRPGPRARRCALVTGFPGFIASRLLRQLLSADPRLTVAVLAQRQSEERARQVLAATPGAEGRVQLLIGDVIDLDLGLSGAEYQALTRRVTELFHLAAISYPGAAPELMARVNIGGTRNVLEFAGACPGLRRLCHVSSCYVSGTRQGVILENELDMGQGFHNAYERTKYKAELEVERAKANLPISVIRPPIVVGDSRSGEIDRLDGLYYMAVLVAVSPLAIPLPLPGAAVAPLNIVPVDFLVAAMTALAADERAIRLTFPAFDPNPLSSRRVYEIIAARAGKRLAPVALNTRALAPLLRLPFVAQWAGVPRQALDYLNNLAIYNDDNTLELLAGTGIACPRFESYVDVLMDFTRRQLQGGAARA